ncbi:UNVERIFIED_CONTAM: hypothetical protein GTU68_011902, partial [Idotea baltica]|nr:hypothetical protein [Idotea baltica]
IKPDWPAPSRVKALTTSRFGGVSQAPFDSLNLGMHVNDEQSDVQVNRNTLVQAINLPSEPAWLDQVHGTDIIELGAGKPACTLIADGAITQVKNVVCAIMTADCLPLFLSNQAGDKVSLLHVGWRGLAQGIVENGISLFNEPPQNIIAWAGPCISIKYFEVGVEVREQIGGPESAYRKSNNKDKFYADMYQLTGERLAQVGIKNYSHTPYCTYADRELFFSHRRDQNTGRMVSLIWFE